MTDDVALRSNAVKGDNRDFRLVCHLDGVTHRVGVRWVDQQDFGAANSQILNVSQLFRRVVLRIQNRSG